MEQIIPSIDFAFYHIPKCGGTSLRHSLYKKFKTIYKKSEIFIPEHSDDITLNFYSNRLDEIKKKYDYPSLKVILAHCTYNGITKLGIDPSFKCTFIRDPVDRVISHYYFFDYKSTGIHMMDLSDDKFNQYCTEIGNLTAYVLGLIDENDNTTSNTTDNGAIVKTINTTELESRLKEFAFIGKLEYFDDGMYQLNKLINNHFNIKGKAKKDIYNANNVVIPKIEDLKLKILPFCSYDYTIYNSFGKYYITHQVS